LAVRTDTTGTQTMITLTAIVLTLSLLMSVRKLAKR
jgi:hypothetical protein